MQDEIPARRRFRALLRRPDLQIDLAEAALCIAWEDQGTAHIHAALHQLDVIAAAARPRIGGLVHPPNIVGALNAYLFDQLGFHGNSLNYDDPENSFLNSVLRRRMGLPITLSVLYIEVGRRLGLPIVGLALPGHFLTRYVAPEIGDLYIDPFSCGRIWSRAECEKQITNFYGSVAPGLFEQVMATPTRRSILQRMLQNLKNNYAARNDPARTLAVVERLLILEPDNVDELRDRGLLRARLGRLHDALEDLDRYALLAPRAADMPRVRQQALQLAEQLSRWN